MESVHSTQFSFDSSFDWLRKEFEGDLQ